MPLRPPFFHVTSTSKIFPYLLTAAKTNAYKIQLPWNLAPHSMLLPNHFELSQLTYFPGVFWTGNILWEGPEIQGINVCVPVSQAGNT